MTLTSIQLDRAIGSITASAAGDTLGSQYEFGPSLPDSTTPEFGVGIFGHAIGEWTDDTSMAMPILDALARGESLLDDGVQAEIVRQWMRWAQTSKDVGLQTRAVFSQLRDSATAADARDAAHAVHLRSGRSGGNGSLMRTGPVALGFLHDDPADVVEAATAIAALTHWEQDNADACALWSLGIRHAILTGELDVRSQVAHLPEDRRARWAAFTEEALAPSAHPRDFAEGNGWVVKALQAALAAVTGAQSLVDALERAVRGGHDTDTVAAITGSLAGAVYGHAALPRAWHDTVHGWPALRMDDLVRLATLAVQHED